MNQGANDLVLKDGSKIAIIGAGPAGSFFADFAFDLALKKDIKISLVLFDGKDFTQTGPRGCNLCAGVISESLNDSLLSRGIVLSGEKIQRKIEGYYLRLRSGGFLLKHPLNKKPITTVFRGNGPRWQDRIGNISFDDYLLEHIQKKGVEVIHEPVKDIRLPTITSDKVKIIYGIGRNEKILEADLMIGAFGLNLPMMRMVQELNIGYKPPKILNAINVEIFLEDDFIRSHIGDNIFIYNWSTSKGIRVANIIPKKDFITVNLIGEQGMNSDDLKEFLALFAKNKNLPDSWEWNDRICFCVPKIAVTSARKPFSDRLVIIGDASCSRYYKNGIESAFTTARVAADTVFNLGIGESALKKGYFNRIKKIIIKDNFFGRIMFKINDWVAGNAFLSEVMMRVTEMELQHGKKSYMRRVLWNMYTGNIPYKRIFIHFLNPILQLKLIAATIQLACLKLLFRLHPATGKKRKNE